jgi:hypothetical protein
MNVIIAKMDGTTNEYPGMDVEGFPSVFFFKGGNQTMENKFNNRKLYEGKRNVSSVIEFLKNNTFNTISDIISLPNEAEIEAKELEEEAKLGDGEEEGSGEDEEAGDDDEHPNEEKEEQLKEEQKNDQPTAGVHDEM